MFNSPYMAQLWGFYSLAITGLMIACGVAFLRQRGSIAWTLFVSSLLTALTTLLPQILMLGYAADWWGWGRNEIGHRRLMELLQISSFVGFAGSFVFHVSLLLYALRGNPDSRRIAELEAILHERMSRNDAP